MEETTKLEEKIKFGQKTVSMKVVVALVVALLLTLGGLVYFALDTMSNDASNNTESTTQEGDEALSDDSASDTDEAEAVDSDIVFKSKNEDVAPFQITLGKDYGIVVQNDGPTEGGSLTSLLIATKEATGIYQSQAINDITVRAQPNYQTFADWKTERISGAEVISEEAVKVGGVSATKYTLDGLSTHYLYVFQKDDTYFAITDWSSANAAPKIEDVLSGFSFVE